MLISPFPFVLNFLQCESPTELKTYSEALFLSQQQPLGETPHDTFLRNVSFIHIYYNGLILHA